mgnify:CR=1 FL=1
MLGEGDDLISGGAGKAASGEMTMMTAGRPEAYARCQAVLDAMAARVYKLGDRAGAGSKVKIINQLLAGVHIAAAAVGVSAVLMAVMVLVAAGESGSVIVIPGIGPKDKPAGGAEGAEPTKQSCAVAAYDAQMMVATPTHPMNQLCDCLVKPEDKVRMVRPPGMNRAVMSNSPPRSSI